MSLLWSVCVCAAIFSVCSSRLVVDLSPASWSSSTLNQFYDLLNNFNPKPQSSSADGIVSATSSAPAAHVGQQALTKGGNAVDAAIVTSLTEIVLCAGSYVSFAGITNWMLYNSTSDEVIEINGEWNHVPRNNIDKISPNPMSYNSVYPVGGSVLIPGYFAAIYSIYEKYSNIEWESLLQPAIYWAKNGFPLTNLLYAYTRTYPQVLKRTQQGTKMYEYIMSLNIGDIFIQSEMNEFLTATAKQGSDYIYKSNWAKLMVKTVQQYGGNITMNDMLHYTELYVEPAVMHYDIGFDVYSTNISYNNGGVDLFEQQNIFMESNMFQNELDYSQNATILAYMMEIHRWNTALDALLISGGSLRAIEYYFSSVLPIFPNEAVSSYESLQQYRITKKYAETVWNVFRNESTLAQLNGILNKLFRSRSNDHSAVRRGTHSDAIVSIDKYGNMVSMVHTINAEPWGSGIFVQGIALSNAASINLGYIKHWIGPNATTPKRVLGPIQPIIAIKNNKMKTKNENRVFGISCIAGSLIPVSFQLLSLMMLWNKSVADTINYSFYQPASGNNLVLPIAVYVKNECDSNDTKCINNNIKYGAIDRSVIDALIHDSRNRKIVGGNIEVLYQNMTMKTFAAPVIGSILVNGTRTGSVSPKINGWSDAVADTIITKHHKHREKWLTIATILGIVFCGLAFIGCLCFLVMFVYKQCGRKRPYDMWSYVSHSSEVTTMNPYQPTSPYIAPKTN